MTGVSSRLEGTEGLARPRLTPLVDAGNGAETTRSVRTLGEIPADGYELVHDATHDATDASPAPASVDPSLMTEGSALRSTTIRVHGTDLSVEYDPAWASKSDVKTVEEALNRYPPGWIRNSIAAGEKNGEAKPTIRMVGRNGMGVPQPSKAPEGRYDPNDNVVYLNMSTFNDPQKRAYLKDARDQPFTGSTWLARTAVHEFAHYVDDAGTKDGRKSRQMASFIGPVKQLAPGLPKHRDPGHGRFRRGVIERNKVVTHGPDYISEYDRRANQGRGVFMSREQETFAEIVTEAVMGGAERRQRMLDNPYQRPMAEAVFAYLDTDLDSDRLSG